MPVAGKTPVGESPENLNRKKGRNEKMKMKRRFWAGLLSFVMLWSLLPASALATEEGTPAAEAAMTLTKNVSGPSAGGTYTITMEAQATGKESTVATQEPMDVVLVLDVSGSMDETIPSRYEEVEAEDVKQDETYYIRVTHSFLFWSWYSYKKVTYCEKCGAFTRGCWDISSYHHKGTQYDPQERQFYKVIDEVEKLPALKTAVNGFIDAVAEKSGDSAIAVVSFASGANNISNGLLPVKDKADVLKNAVNGLTADGATRADLGMQQAAEILTKGTHAKKIVVMFTDGEPTAHRNFEVNVANGAIQAAKGMKDAGTQVFTVGVFDKASEDTTNYMNYVSSNYPKAESMENPGTGSEEAGYYMTADDADGLNTIFKTISKTITVPTNAELNTETVVEDTLSDYFTFDTDTPATGSVKVYAKAKDGTRTDITEDAKVEVVGKKVTVKGYNFAEHFKGSAKEETLVIEITVKPSGVGCATATIPTNADDNSNYAAKATLNSTVVASAESATVTGCYVEYDLDGGTGDVPGKLYYPKYAKVAVTDVKPVKENYDFAGWKNGENTVSSGDKVEVLSDVTLVAQWRPKAETKYQLVYFAGSDGFLPGKTTQYATSKADPTMYDKDATASVKYDDPDFKITVTADQTLFIGWTEDSESVGKIYKLRDEVPTLVTEVKMTGDKAVYAVYGEDANHDGTPDVYQAKVTYKVEKGCWTDEHGNVLPETEIVKWFNLYEQQADHTWKKCSPAPVLGDTVPKGHSGQPGYTGAGWFMDDNPNEMESAPDRRTEVNKSETLYTFVYKDATHKTDIVDTLNAIVKKEFTKANNVESGDVTFTAKATITKQPEVVIQSLPAVESAGASHTIHGTVTLSTKDGTGSFEFARSLDDVNPADGVYLVEVSEVNGGADNVTYDNRTFIVEITVKNGAVDKNSVRVMSFVDDKELAPVTDGRITFKNTYTKSNSGGHDSSSDIYYLVIKKIDAQDGHALKDAKFGLYADDEQIATAISSSKGYARFSLDERVYKKLVKNDDLYVMELTAPDGYVKSSRKYDVSVNAFVKNFGAQEHAITVTNSRSSTPDRLNDEEHFAYVIGYKDGNVRPYGLISRAETTTIFFRLLKDSVRDGNLLTSNTYTDVADSYWANTAISTMTGLGIVQGRTATTFDPYAPITRAQFAAICARFDDGKTQGGQTFTDIQGHWAQAYIERAAELGWIKGFEDGTFRPDTYITRAQAMTMINRVLNRIPEDADDLLSNMNVWPDCNPGDWFYLAVQEATNSHDYKHKAGNYETWSSMNKDPDWTRYEN